MVRTKLQHLLINLGGVDAPPGAGRPLCRLNQSLDIAAGRF
jgi:hypothetical protein